MKKNDVNLEKVHSIYKESQLLDDNESAVDRSELQTLSDAWKGDDIPSLQRKTVEQQLLNLKEGLIDPVFVTLIEALNSLHLEKFSLLDAACASGYYSEVIKSQVKEKSIQYYGSDYSEGMIKLARSL
jgi:hypothetical protein